MVLLLHIYNTVVQPLFNNLHSNMVLLLLDVYINDRIGSDKFTFQYGVTITLLLFF